MNMVNAVGGITMLVLAPGPRPEPKVGLNVHLVF